MFYWNGLGGSFSEKYPTITEAFGVYQKCDCNKYQLPVKITMINECDQSCSKMKWSADQNDSFQCLYFQGMVCWEILVSTEIA